VGFIVWFRFTFLLILLPNLQQLTFALPNDKPSLQRFVCNTGYTLRECQEQIVILKRVVANYTAAERGDWTWILVRSEDWKGILLSRGLDPDSPAFTFCPKRETFVEEALLTQVPVRGRELLLKWNMSANDLLDLAIRHELGHALCNDPSEQNADRVAKLLEQRNTVSCRPTSRPKRDQHE